MKLHLARGVVALLNVLLSLVTAALFILFVLLRPVTSLADTSLSTTLGSCFHALLAIVSITAAALLLRRRTLQTGLKLHFGIANAVLLYSLVSTLIDVRGQASDHFTALVLQSFYWGLAFCGLWFGTGLTLKTLMELEAAKHNGALWEAGVKLVPSAEARRASRVNQAPYLPAGSVTIETTNHSEPITQKIRG